MSSKALRGPKPMLLLQGAVAGGLLVAAPATVLTVTVLLCPSIAFALFETAKGRPVARTMALCGSAGAFGPIRSLWDHGNTVMDALDELSNLSAPLSTWTLCAAGWLLSEAAHLACRYAINVRAKLKAAALQREEAALLDEWTLLDQRAEP